MVVGQLTCTSMCASYVCRFIVTVELNLKMDVLSSEQEISLAGEHWVVNVGNWSNSERT